MSVDIPALLETLGLNRDTYQVAEGSAFRDQWFPFTDVALPLVLRNVDPTSLSWLQNCLPRAYPPQHELYWIGSATEPSQIQTITMAGLATYQGAPPAALMVIPPLVQERSLNELANIVARLRAPGGCPWDQEQTLKSLRPEMLSEAYEVCEAIDLSDHDNLQEELGDLIMDILFLINIAWDEGLFQLSDVVAGICQKMIRRHPHVYGNLDAEDSTAVLAQWEEIKQAEYAARGKTRRLLDGIPASLPSLEAARLLQNKASRAGYETALPAASAEPNSTEQSTEYQLGLRLWELVSEALLHDLNPEEALRKCNDRFRLQVDSVTSPSSKTSP